MNSVNLFRISIALPTSFCDGGNMDLSGTPSSSLLSSSTVSASCGRYSSTNLSTDNGRDYLVGTSLSKSTRPSVPKFIGFAKLIQVKL